MEEIIKKAQLKGMDQHCCKRLGSSSAGTHLPYRLMAVKSQPIHLSIDNSKTDVSKSAVIVKAQEQTCSNHMSYMVQSLCVQLVHLTPCTWH